MKAIRIAILIGCMVLFTMATCVAMAQSSTLHADLISRAERGNEVQVAYGIEATDLPTVAIDHGHLISYAIVYDPSRGWRATVIAALDRCDGTLTVQAGTATQELTHQHCIHMPIAPYGGTP